MPRWSPLASQVQRAQFITVVGGGSAGVEMAAEIKTEYPEKEVGILRKRWVPQERGGHGWAQGGAQEWKKELLYGGWPIMGCGLVLTWAQWNFFLLVMEYPSTDALGTQRGSHKL